MRKTGLALFAAWVTLLTAQEPPEFRTQTSLAVVRFHVTHKGR